MTRVAPEKVKGRFVNPAARDLESPGFKEMMRWRRERKELPKAPPPRVERAEAPAKLAPSPEKGYRASWSGHSSVVLQLDGLTYLTDPVWSERVGGVVKRLTPPGLPWKSLPHVDALLISHNHYDHLDAGTIARLPKTTSVHCPTGVGAWFERRGFRDVRELSWWDSVTLGDHRVTFLPAQHFSGRKPWDRDQTLWGGFVVEGSRGTTAYYAGDTGYWDKLSQVGEAFPHIDLAMIPIGAYQPRWFMSTVHVDPPEAGKLFLELNAKALLPVHWGTFRLADEPIDEPPRALCAWWKEQDLSDESLLIPKLGESFEHAR